MLDGSLTVAARSSLPMWAWIALLVLFTALASWNLAVALGLLPKIRGLRWGEFGQGPPISRIGHAGWACLFTCIAIALGEGGRSDLAWPWLIPGFALVVLAGGIDAYRHRKR